MTRVRWFGAAFGALSLTLQPSYPSTASEIGAWSLVALLAAGNLVIWGAQGRVKSTRAQEVLGRVAFAFDAVVIAGLVWVFAFEDPYVTWALLFIVPMEGALRYRLPGALAGAAAVGVFFAFQSMRVGTLHDEPFDLATFVFVLCLAFVIAGVTGSMAENWHQQSLAVQRQSLKLAELDRLKDRFLAVTSHEIRGPLTAIIASLDTIKKRGDRLTPEQRTNLLDMASQQGTQLARLVDDLLITSQIQGGRLNLHTGWCDLQEVVQQAIEAAASKRVDHRLEVYAEPVRALTDPSRAGQIVRNLVENSYKYTPAHASVTVTAATEPGGIVLKVEDDGPGIPSSKRAQLFEAFSRIEETSAGQEGVGLGLFVVSQLVDAMKGRIDLSSSSRGTCFAIHLPCETEAGGGTRLSVVQSEDAAG